MHKLYEENGKTSYEPADLKAHRMVNVILDEAAAEGLPEELPELSIEPTCKINLPLFSLVLILSPINDSVSSLNEIL